MSKDALRRLPENEETRTYLAGLADRYKSAGSAQDARKAVDKCLGERPLTDLLYEQRKERPL